MTDQSTDWAVETSEIARDLGRHTAERVASAMQQSLSICGERAEAVAVATAGVIAALQVARGVYAGLMDEDVGAVSLREVALAVVETLEEAIS